MLKLIAAAIALAATTAPAFAQADGATQSVHVSYADLDLSHPAAVRTLDRRLHAAVGTVCRADAGADTSASLAALHCRKAAQLAFANQRAAAIARANTNTQLALNTPAR